jgi:protein-disulfide isomerase
VLFKSFCTATCNGPGQSVFNTQQVAGLAAGEQNKFWQYTELFYHEQGQEDTGYVNENYLTGLANQVTGLNLTQWQSDRSNPNLAAQVASDGTNGQAIGVQGTPTLIFKGPKGQASPNASVPTYAQLQATIKQVS